MPDIRLLNIENLTFQTFRDNKAPAYAIASHRWIPGREATYQDMLKESDKDLPKFEKIRNFCKFVRRRNDYLAYIMRTRSKAVQQPRLEWLWIDTCCINKENSTELTTSINSMFSWYARSSECLVYLHDVPVRLSQEGSGLMEFWQSSWFTRGWTLQELLAPTYAVFLTKGWEVLGHKCRYHAEGVAGPECACDYGGPVINDLLSVVSGIHRSALLPAVHDASSTALSLEPDVKAQWVQNRRTLETEDLAYCLFGVMGVQLPILYGEGAKAWVRLEDELSKKASKKVHLPKPFFLESSDDDDIHRSDFTAFEFDSTGQASQEHECRLTCIICGFSFLGRTQCLEHLKIHLIFHSWHRCGVGGCASAFRSKSELRHHQRRHRPRTLKRRNCPATFDYMKDLRRHQAIHEARQFTCPHCARAFSRMDNLNRHVAANHGQVGLNNPNHPPNQDERSVGAGRSERAISHSLAIQSQGPSDISFEESEDDVDVNRIHSDEKISECGQWTADEKQSWADEFREQQRSPSCGTVRLTRSPA